MSTSVLTKESVDAFSADASALSEGLSHVIFGQGEVVRQVVIAMLAGGHVLLEGLPGLGKTQLAKAAAHLAGLPLSRVQGTPDLMPADIIGAEILRQDADGRAYLDFSPGPIFSSFLLLDEVNRAPPRTQSALLEAMQERRVTAGGETRLLPDPFIVMATQNMIEFEGTYPLPEAQLDRFMMKIDVLYPERPALMSMLNARSEELPPAVMSEQRLREMQALVPKVAVADHVAEAAVDLVMATHPAEAALGVVTDHVVHGASPRALKALLRAGCALALQDGRGHLSRRDLEELALPILRHRIFLSVGARLDGVSPDMILEQVLMQWKAARRS